MYNFLTLGLRYSKFEKLGIEQLADATYHILKLQALPRVSFAKATRVLHRIKFVEQLK